MLHSTNYIYLSSFCFLITGIHYNPVELVDRESEKGKEKLKGKSLGARRGTQNAIKDTCSEEAQEKTRQHQQLGGSVVVCHMCESFVNLGR